MEQNESSMSVHFHSTQRSEKKDKLKKKENFVVIKKKK